MIRILYLQGKRSLRESERTSYETPKSSAYAESWKVVLQNIKMQCMSMSMKLQCMQETNIHEKKQQNIMCFKIHDTRETITLEKETHRKSCAGTWTRSFSVYEKHLLSRRKLTKHYVLEDPSNPVYAYAYVKKCGKNVQRPIEWLLRTAIYYTNFRQPSEKGYNFKQR